MELKYDPIKAKLIERAKQDLRRMEREFSEETMKLTGVSKGLVLKHRCTGHLYVVEGFYARGSRASISARRRYKTGRPDAATTSYVSLSEVDPIYEEIAA